MVDSTGKAISPPADNALGAMDLALDAAGGSDTRSDGFQLTWSGLANSYEYPTQLVPVQFVNLAP